MRAFKYLALAATAFAMPASAALVGDFRLDGNATNQAGGALTLNTNGATYATIPGASGLSFVANGGPSVTGFSSPSDFSIETQFQFDATSGYRRIADFLNLSSDTGLYAYNGTLNFYNVAGTSTLTIAPGQLATVVLTRDAAGSTTGYVNGVAYWNFTNAALTAVTNNINFFRDDNSVGGEASSGFVNYIRVYDTALTADQVAALTPPGSVGGVPEPANWALMIGGFGLVGAASRRRIRAVA